MLTPAYYNEFEPYAAKWLRNLIAKNLIAPGDVDERSIEDVTPDDLKGYRQCHFFAGIGVWSYALRRAGWDDNERVWTGSCPCQPFSTAGKSEGFNDERHLWPSFAWLIQECQPPAILGEQVASKATLPWIDLVHADLEAMGYAFGCVPFPSAGVGAPHIRDRTYWLAYSLGNGRERGLSGREDSQWQALNGSLGRGGAVSNMGHPAQHGERAQYGKSIASVRREEPIGGPSVLSRLEHAGSIGCGEVGAINGPSRGGSVAGNESAGGMAYPYGSKPQQFTGEGARSDETPIAGPCGEFNGRSELLAASSAAGPVNGIWRDADWLLCRDGKWRPVRSGSFPLADGAPSRVGRLRAYGNAINAEAATEFIKIAMACRP